MCCFDCVYVVVKCKIVEGVIGWFIVFKLSLCDQFLFFFEYFCFESSGGLFIDMGIYDFDFVCWFMGEVKIVYSIGVVVVDLCIVDVGDVDNVFSLFIFILGVIGLISFSCNGVYGYVINIEIVGIEGMFQIGYDCEIVFFVMINGSIVYDMVFGFFECFDQVYFMQFQDFVDNFCFDCLVLIICVDGVVV